MFVQYEFDKQRRNSKVKQAFGMARLQRELGTNEPNHEVDEGIEGMRSTHRLLSIATKLNHSKMEILLAETAQRPTSIMLNVSVDGRFHVNFF